MADHQANNREQPMRAPGPTDFRLLAGLLSTLLLVISSLTNASASPAGEDPLARVARQAQNFAEQLASNRQVKYSSAERSAIRRASLALLNNDRCSTAQTLIQQAITGQPRVPFADWYRLASAAICAKHRTNAVNAAWLAAGQAANNSQRGKAWFLLGQALEAHWAYGASNALAAYRQARQYSNAPRVRNAIRRLERQLFEQQGLRVERVRVQRDDSAPALCIDFSAPMALPSERRYADFIRFEPAFDALYRRVGGDQLCVDGAEYGHSYRVRLLRGLTSDQGKELRAPFEQQVATGDRPPALWFANSRYVLPPGGGVPVHAVNVEQVHLQLYRIGDRNLLNDWVRDKFRTELYPYQLEEIRDKLGEALWQGDADLVTRPNRESVTSLSLAAALRPRPGVYVLTATPASEDQDGGPVASQWLVVSDIGMTEYRGKDGLTLVTRSLTGATPLAGVQLTLYARNNQMLAEVETDGNGVARLPNRLLQQDGGNRPVLLMAQLRGDTGSDFNFLDISGSPFDLSDRGVGGRPSPGPMDAFIYTERGVYRPGETVSVNLLLRDDRGIAVDGLPLTLRLHRPDGQLALETVLQPAGAGGYQSEVPISNAARTGQWRFTAYLDRDAAALGQADFQVEAIVPPRIEVKPVRLPDGPLAPGSASEFAVQARYLFGAPASDLAASGEVRIEPDPTPLEALPGFEFGPVDETYDARTEVLEATRTDRNGDARFGFVIENLPDSRRPLRARLRAEVRDVDGRVSATQSWLRLGRTAPLIGVKGPADGQVSEGRDAVFEVVLVDPDGQLAAAPGLHYRLVREQSHYQWYRADGRWRYQRTVRDQTVRQGELAVPAAGPARLAFKLDYGRYRVEVDDPASGSLTSLRVQSGWADQDPNSDTPDRLTLRSDRAQYQPGDIARLAIEAPFAGRASIVVASDRVLSVRDIALADGQQTVDLAIDPAWGAGAYALVTAYRPDTGATKGAGHGPRRAVGVAWLGIDPDRHRLQVGIDAPPKVRPGQRLPVGVEVQGQAAGESVYLTLAAVDEGVLQLTDYRAPDPLTHYFGQRRLGVEIRDLYGRLIDGHAGPAGRVRAGGGAGGRAGMADSAIEVVSLYSGIVPLGEDGRATVPLDLPLFDGRLRLMAVAWSARRVGATSQPLTVRDPLVLMASLPRFAALGDRFDAAVTLHNVEGPAGEYRLGWSLAGGVGLDADGGAEPRMERRYPLKQGDSAQLRLPLRAGELGRGILRLSVQGPGGFSVGRELAVAIRAPFLPDSRRLLGTLQPGQSATLGPDLVDGMLPATVDARISLSASPDLGVPGLLRELDLYPYGCVEQLTSRAFPLLDLDRLQQVWGYRPDVDLPARLGDGISGILDKQLPNGGFALWDGRGPEQPWLTVYALDFLQRVRASAPPLGSVAGADRVPQFAWSRGLEWLRRRISYPNVDQPRELAVQTYAVYLLARVGEHPIETARYLFDQGRQKLPSPLAAAQLGAALALMGDHERAEQAFAMAAGIERKGWFGDYGSVLRDLAGRLLLRTEALGQDDNSAVLIAELRGRIAEQKWLSTQEQAWLVRAASAVAHPGAPLKLAIDGHPQPDRTAPLLLQPDSAALADGVALRNLGDGPAWYSLSVDGSPQQALPPIHAGFTLTRRLYDLQGNEVSPWHLVQGQALVVVVDGQVQTKDLRHQALIIDPLPAGIEADSTGLVNARSTGEMSWLKGLSATSYSDTLDDRYVAALDLAPGTHDFRIAYLARAVTPGDYRYPPVTIEDMYKPRYRARAEAGRARVEASQ